MSQIGSGTYATLDAFLGAFAIARGAHPKAIQERMGHSSINTTLNVYGGLFPHLEEAIADGLDELYAAAQS